MSNPKVFEYAKEIGMTPLALMDKIREWQLPVKSHMAELEPEVLEQIKVRLSGSSSSDDSASKAKSKTKSAGTKTAVKAAPKTTAKVGKSGASTTVGVGLAAATKTTGKKPALKNSGETPVAIQAVVTPVTSRPTVLRRKAAKDSEGPNQDGEIVGNEAELETDSILHSESHGNGADLAAHQNVATSSSVARQAVQQESHPENMGETVDKTKNIKIRTSLEDNTLAKKAHQGMFAKESSETGSGAAEKIEKITAKALDKNLDKTVDKSIQKPGAGVQSAIGGAVSGTGQSSAAGSGTKSSVNPAAVSTSLTGTSSTPGGLQASATGATGSTLDEDERAKVAAGAVGSSSTGGANQAVSGSAAAGAGPGPSRKKEVLVGTSGVASLATPAPGLGRRNIIGRMDLSRVSSPAHANRSSGGPSGGQDRGGQQNRGGFAGGAPRAGAGARTLRTGFVAQAAPPPAFPEFETEESRRGKDIDKRAKRLSSGGGGEGPVSALSPREKTEEENKEFNPVEFRKREMVFQPKKKKGMLNREALRTQITKPKASKRVVRINGTIKLSVLADEMGLKVAQLTKTLMANGVMATPSTDLDYDTVALILPEFGFEAQNVLKTAVELADETAFGDLKAERIVRIPVVTVMGHVDHGKTSLLDAIRKTDVAAGEAGGITQHIGAYSVKLEDGHLITFLDTPGHEAFTAMRARGANVTDIAVIVVAADDGMMPQTQEAINHAKAAGVPIIVAVNKIDKPGANTERIKQQLTELEIVPEEWGGTTIFCEVSATKKTGIKELLEQIKLVAEVQELRANPKRSGTGVVIEAKMEKGRGSVATVLVKDGTIRVGQHVIAGTVKGRVRSLMNDRGERVTEAGPGIPVEVLGFENTPMAGDRCDVVVDDEAANRITTLNQQQRDALTNAPKKLTLEDIFSKVTRGDVKELALVLKADVHGSIEAITGLLQKLNNNEVKTKVIHTGVGGINESDVLLAHAAKGIVLGFNVRPDGGAQSQSKRLGVDIRSYTIVYELVDEMKKALQGLLTPDVVEKVVARIEVRNVFTVPKIGAIGGCFVLDGKVQRSNSVRLIRDGKIVYAGKIGSLKRFKDDAREVAAGFECGVGIENYNDIKVGDIIEAFVREEVARELKPSSDAQV